MQLQRLESVDAFVVRDLDGVPAVGVVRSAPKILVDGAQWLARSMTYRFASFGTQRGGASAGINARPDDRPAAIAAFADAVAEDVGAGTLLLEPAKGVAPEALASLRAADPRPDAWWAARPALTTAGVLAAAGTIGGLDGRTVVLEGVDAMGPTLRAALVEGLAAAGARIVAVSTAQGGHQDAAGCSPDAIEAAVGGGDGAANASVEEALVAEADLLLAGSRAGVVGHALATELTVGAVVPWGAMPVTAKALAELRRSERVVLPDFVTTAGPSIVESEAAGDPDALDTVRSAVTDVLAEVADHEHGPLLGACLRAEAFLATWCDELPFGRPIA